MTNSKGFLIVIGGGILSTYAIEAAQRVGCGVICTDRDPNCPGASLADMFSKADVYSVEEQETVARDYQACYGDALKGIFIAGIDAAHIGSVVAEQMAWPHVNPKAAATCRMKEIFRETLDKAGIRQPGWLTVNARTPTSVLEKLYMGKPLLVKAIDNSGGRGVTYVDDGPALGRAAGRARDASMEGVNLLLIEARVPGREFSTEIVNIDGDWHYLNTVERFFLEDSPYPIEIGHVNPAPITDEMQAAIFKTAIQTAEAVGADWGVFKCDTIVTDSDIYVIEACCRWSGGFDSQETTPLATGRDFLAFGARMAAGEAVTEFDVELERQWNRAAAVWCPMPEPMTVNSIDTWYAEQISGVRDVVIVKEPPIAIDIDSSAARPVYVIAEGETMEWALAAAREGAVRVRFA